MKLYRIKPAAIAVPSQVWDGLEAVRRSGLVNMLDRPRVIELAGKLGFAEAAEWSRRHPRAYARGIFRGFSAIADPQRRASEQGENIRIHQDGAGPKAVGETAGRAATPLIGEGHTMASQTTLKDAGGKYFEHLEATGKNPRTVATYRRQFAVIAGFFGEDKKLAAIRPADVGRFLKSDALLKKPTGKERAEATVNQIVRVLRMMLEWAQSEGLVEAVAFPKDAMPKRRRQSADGAPGADA